jgi:hypothetical protein
MDLRPTFLDIRNKLSRGGLWSRGGEIGTLDPAEFDARDFRILLARLSTYEDTSLSFTHNILYSLFASRGWFPDWSFLPTAQDRSVYAEAGIPWLFGTQSKRDWREFDVIGFANSITQETGNLFWFLKNSGIPLEKSARLADADIPLVIMGGANSGSSSALICPNPVVDGIFTGEDFETIARLFALVREGRARGATKTEILESLETVDGFFQPDRPRPIKKFNARSIELSPLYAEMPVNYGGGNPGKSVLAISEGCAGFCSFCNESFVRKPYREGSVESLLDEARSLKAETGADTVDLFSFNFNMHKGLYELIEGLVPLFSQIGLKSQRFDSIAEDPNLIDVEKALGKSVYTCGLEGISDRLRRFLNKNLSEQQVRKSVSVLVSAAVREIKVFLIATGRESGEDFDEWSRFLAWVKELRTPQGKQVRFVFSITPLVRFPHTPLEFEPTPEADDLRAIIGKILALTQKAGFECRQAASVEESLFCDQLLRAGRPEIFEAFKSAVLESDFIYEREIPESVYRLFLKKLAALGLDPAALRRDFSFEKNAASPWALLDMGVSRKYLENQYLRNSEYREMEPDAAVLCGKGLPRPSRQEIESIKQKIALVKKDEILIEIPCVLGERYANLPREYPALPIARALMKTDAALIPLYRGFSSSFWQQGAETDVPLWGKDVLSLKFRSSARAYLSSRKADFWSAVNADLAPHSISVSPPSASAFSCTLRMESSFDIDAGYLVQNGLKHVYAKTAEGCFAYQFTKEALKKNVMLSLEVEKRSDGVCVVTLVPGQKFDITDFLQRAFRTQDKNGWRRIGVEAR